MCTCYCGVCVSQNGEGSRSLCWSNIPLRAPKSPPSVAVNPKTGRRYP
jgi:hypothetical protein